MAIQPKLIAAMGGVTLLTFVANFAAFILCYNFLATPYLEPPQQEANAGFILSGAIALFAAAALATGIAAYLASKARKPPEDGGAPLAKS